MVPIDSQKHLGILSTVMNTNPQFVVALFALACLIDQLHFVLLLMEPVSTACLTFDPTDRPQCSALLKV
jgi:hypothetical protein